MPDSLFRDEAVQFHRGGLYRPGAPLGIPTRVRGAYAALGVAFLAGVVVLGTLSIGDWVAGTARVTTPPGGGPARVVASIDAAGVQAGAPAQLHRVGRPVAELQVESVNGSEVTALLRPPDGAPDGATGVLAVRVGSIPLYRALFPWLSSRRAGR